MFLVSEVILDLIRSRDLGAIEASKARMVGKYAAAIRPYWIVMPARVLDAVDISRSNIEVRSSAVGGGGRFMTHVYYRAGHSIREDVPLDVSCFLDEFCANWYWRKSLIDDAAMRGARGLLFGYGQFRNVADEIRLRGPNDPLGW